MIALLLLALVATASARSSRFSDDSSSCSAPPASLEVCLSQVFVSIEGGLNAIAQTLQQNEAGIKSEMHHEHTLLHSEVSWVSLVESIASSVESAVNIDYFALSVQIVQLNAEKSEIEAAYQKAEEYLQELQVLIQQVIEEEGAVVAEYVKVQGEKWSLYSAISAIVYEKLVIEQEQAEIEGVVAKLHAEMQLIYEKVAQLNKRQGWLLSWEEKLSFDLHELQSDIVSFRALEVDLYARELSLYEEQQELLIKVEYAQSCIESLEEEYVEVLAQLEKLSGYEVHLREVESSVSSEVSIFVYAYEEFTCEDSLLYYEACSSHSVHADAIPEGAADVAVPAVEPTEE